MDILSRYGIAGYILLIVVYLYCPQAADVFRNELAKNSLGFVVLNVFIGLPLGYLVNQIASFAYHLVPFLGLRRSPPSKILISKEAQCEMQTNERLLAELKHEFQLREWYAWRWIHLTINLNTLVAIAIALLLSCFINASFNGCFLPLYSLVSGKVIVLVVLIVSILIICYNA